MCAITGIFTLYSTGLQQIDMEKHIADQGATPFAIPKPHLSVLLDAVVEHCIETAKEKIGKKLLLQERCIEYCYICNASSKPSVRYRAISKRIWYISKDRMTGVTGYKIDHRDVLTKPYDGLYCSACEQEHGINERLKQRAKEEKIKLTIRQNSWQKTKKKPAKQ